MKKFIALLISVAMLLCLTAAFASIEECPEDGTHRVSCIYCGGMCFSYCYGERVSMGQGTHGLVNPCTVTYFKSRGAYCCSDCYTIQQNQGYHECINFHYNCGRGTVYICPMNGGVM